MELDNGQWAKGTRKSSKNISVPVRRADGNHAIDWMHVQTSADARPRKPRADRSRRSNAVADRLADLSRPLRQRPNRRLAHRLSDAAPNQAQLVRRLHR